MTFKSFVFSILVVFILTLPAAAAEQKSVYDQVMERGSIRCGYGLWAPILMKDPNTGKLSGIAYDLVEEIGKRLSLQIDWAEETSWGATVEGLVTNRYDMICVGMALSSARARVIGFSQPLLYMGLYIIGRQDDTRFDKDYKVLNDPKYKIAVLEGDMSSITARQKFSKATVSAMPQSSDYSLLLKEVETGKADVTIMEIATFKKYEKTNPGKLKIINQGQPITTMPGSFGLPRNDLAFKSMIDITLSELMGDGTLESIVQKYEEVPGAFLRVARPYEVVK